MRPYNKERHFTKGASGCRRSCDAPHRKRCLRVDKRSARQEVRNEILKEFTYENV